MTAAIETEALTKAFGDLRAVDGLSLRVEAGEIFGFLGPNGAGKSTTIRMLMGFLKPTSGHAMVLGARPGDPSVHRRIGYLPGDLKLDRRYSGADVVAFYGALRGGGCEERAAQLAQRFELDLSRPAGQLSTGNRRKIGIVQAFMHRPQLLILDEPTSGLDPLLQNTFLELVREAAHERATVFLSSHLLPEVEALAGRVGVLRQGKLVAIETIAGLRERARHRIEFRVMGTVSAEPFRDLPGVVSATVRGEVVEVIVQGSVDAVLKAAARMTVTRISTPGDDLAEMFIALYHGDEA